MALAGWRQGHDQRKDGRRRTARSHRVRWPVRCHLLRRGRVLPPAKRRQGTGGTSARSAGPVGGSDRSRQVRPRGSRRRHGRYMCGPHGGKAWSEGCIHPGSTRARREQQLRGPGLAKRNREKQEVRRRGHRAGGAGAEEARPLRPHQHAGDLRGREEGGPGAGRRYHLALPGASRQCGRNEGRTHSCRDRTEHRHQRTSPVHRPLVRGLHRRWCHRCAGRRGLRHDAQRAYGPLQPMERQGHR